MWEHIKLHLRTGKQKGGGCQRCGSRSQNGGKKTDTGKDGWRHIAGKVKKGWSVRFAEKTRGYYHTLCKAAARAKKTQRKKEESHGKPEKGNRWVASISKKISFNKSVGVKMWKKKMGGGSRLGGHSNQVWWNGTKKIKKEKDSIIPSTLA